MNADIWSWMVLILVGAVAGCDGSGRALPDAGNAGDTDADAETGADFDVSVELSSAIETVAIVTWSRESGGVGEATIDFGRIGGEEWEYEALVDESDHDSGKYRTLLVGMKQNSEYRFRINADGVTSDEYTVRTGYIPINIPPPTIDEVNASVSAGGFIVTGTFTVLMGGTPVAYIMDADGDIVWAFGAQGVTDITAARLSYDGKNMWMVPANYSGEGGAVFRVSMDGLDTETIDVIGAYHDIFPVQGETMAFVDYSGSCCKLKEVTPNGSVFGIYDLSAAGYRDCNCNAMRYSESEGLYVVSETMSGDYVAFERTGKLRWTSRPDGHHHGCHLTNDSFLAFFNPSTVREYSIDQSGIVSEIWSYSADNSTTFLGDVQRLPGGNTLVTFSDDAVIHEVDSGANLVKSITFDDAIGFTAWRGSLYEPPPDVVL